MLIIETRKQSHLKRRKVATVDHTQEQNKLKSYSCKGNDKHDDVDAKKFSML